MAQQREHSYLEGIDRKSMIFFSGGKFNWKKSEQEIWHKLEFAISKHPSTRTIRLNKVVLWVIAASFSVLIGLGIFLKLYTKQVISPAGSHLSVNLPDGSTVMLNAESSVKYHPYWWHFKRNLYLEGEGLFDVEKGEKFEVLSSNGKTEVLGTSFNIFAREEKYKVICLTGLVKVTSTTNNQVILKPNSSAEVNTNGKITVLKDIDTFPEISWEKNIFLFTATPVREVFCEIERQYNINISVKIDNYALYTGNFTSTENVEEVLSYVCPALGLKFTKESSTQYFVTLESE